MLLSLIFCSFAVLSAQTEPEKKSAQMLQVALRGCFYFAPNTDGRKNISVINAEKTKIQSQICDKERLSTYTGVVLLNNTFTIKNGKITVRNDKIIPLGLTQNVEISFLEKSADSYSLTVKINENEKLSLTMKENELAFLPAGWLDAENPASAAYFVLSIAELKSVKQ